MHRTVRVLVAGIVCTITGCTIGADPPPRTDPPPPPTPEMVVDAGPPPPNPLDSLVASEVPPVQGGTMALTDDGVVVVDPQTGLVALVDLDEGITAQAMVDWRDHPGRVAVDADGRIHVVLRRAGAIATFAPDLSAHETREVCGAPRGLAFDEAADALQVACATGELVTLPAAGGELTRAVLVEPDLRDVVLTDDGRLHVTTFRSAELLTLDADGAVVDRRLPGGIMEEDGRMEPFGVRPHVAWRARALPGGRVLVSHQMHVASQVDVDRRGYSGGGSPCGVAVSAMVSVFPPEGAASRHGVSFTTLPVDVAISADVEGPEIAVVADAANDMMDLGVLSSGARRVDLSHASTPCGDREMIFGRDTAPFVGTTSVEVAPDGRVILQEIGSGRLVQVLTDDVPTLVVDHPNPPGVGRAHTFFHARTRSELACASCHPEGGEDGHVWDFMGTGPRRTQTLLGGVVDTAPFHWSGDQPSMSTIMTSAMDRMFGHLEPADVPAMEAWLDVQPIDRGPALRPEAIERGQATFEARCASCHAGEALTDDRNHDVGTGGSFQVPSLRGVAYHAPYLHHGCAADVDAVLDGTCGEGASHADLSDLSDAQRADLFAYVRSL